MNGFKFRYPNELLARAARRAAALYRHTEIDEEYRKRARVKVVNWVVRVETDGGELEGIYLDVTLKISRANGQRSVVSEYWLYHDGKIRVIL